jgi:WD40 repeat protein
MRGARLEQLETWAATTDLAIGRPERAYLKASVDQRNREREEEERRRQHEARIERRSARRLRGLVAVFAVAALIAASLTVVATNQSSRAEREARIATARELAAAAVANLDVDAELSALLASEAVETTRFSAGTVLPEAEEALHRAVVASRLKLKVPGVGGALAWSLTGVFVTEGPEDSGMIDIRDSETGESVLSFQGHDPDVNHVAFSSDGSRLASTGDDGELKVWDPSTGRLLSSLSGGGSVWGPSFSADGSLVAAAWDFFDVRVLDLSTDRVVSTFRVPGAFSTALSPDGKQLAVVGDRDAVFDVETGQERFRLSGVKGVGGEVSWSPDGRYLAAGGEDAAGVWDAETGRLRHTLLGHTGSVLGVAWSPDSSRLVTGGADGTARVWEIGAGVRELWSLSAQETRSGINGVAFSSDGTRVMAGDLGISAVQIWDLGPTGDAEWLNLPASVATEVEFMPDGRRVVTSPSGGSGVTIWDLQTGRDLRTIGPATDGFRIESFDVSPDGGSIAVGGWVPGAPYGGDVARMWDLGTGEEVFTIRHPLDVTEVTFSPDGEHLVTESYDGAARIVDRVGRVVRVLREEMSILEVRFSPDGRLLAAVAATGDSETARVTIWDWLRGEVARTMEVGRTFNDEYGLAFDPSGFRIAIGGSEGLAEIKDVESGANVAVLQGPSGGATDIAFAPDGSRVAVANADGTVRVFEADTGAPQLVLPGPGCPTSTVAFSPNGTKLASASLCDGVRIWALDIDDLLEIARQEVTRPLTDEECRRFLHLEACP